MRSVKLVWLFVICAVAGLRSQSIPKALTVARAEIQMVDRLGKPVPFRLTSLKDVRGKNAISYCLGGVCKGLPMGGYTYSARVSFNDEVVEGHTFLGNPTELVTIVYRPQNVDESSFEVSGQVGGRFGLDRVWVRFLQVFGGHATDAKVTGNGKFTVRLDSGVYAVLVIRHDRVVAHQVYDCCRGSGPNPIPIYIELK